MKKHLLLLITLSATCCMADIKLPALISDNMMLQQQSNARIWGWADPDEHITVSPDWPGATKTETTANPDGRWQLRFPTPEAGGPYSIRFTGNNQLTITNVLLGEIWVCSGQSNMGMQLKGRPNQHVIDSEKDIASSANSSIRFFEVPNKTSNKALEDVVGKWVECTPETSAIFSAAGYHFAREVNAQTHLPVGMIHSSWGGTPAESWIKEKLLANEPTAQKYMLDYYKGVADWEKRAAIAKVNGEKAPKRPYGSSPAAKPGALYNGMIAPLTPMTIKGAIWYQGEANRRRALEYRSLFPLLINSWRDAFENTDMPFYFVQLAAFKDAGFIKIREAQLMTLKEKNTGMAVAIDAGHMTRIHPPQKKTVGKRLAYWALAKDYGMDIPCSGPLYKDYKVEGDKIRIRFNYADGLKPKDGTITGFTIAGADNQFIEAQTKIDGDSILVFSESIKAPVSVRYGWNATFEGCLINAGELPASPFRTDDW